jgi:hypothetical protein
MVLGSIFTIGSIGFVDRSPLLPFCPWPFIISSLSGKGFVTVLMMSQGHDALWLFFIASFHVGLLGKPANVSRYHTNSGCILSS